MWPDGGGKGITLRARMAWLPVLLLATSGCAIKAPHLRAAEQCHFVSYPLDVESPSSTATAIATSVTTTRSMSDLIDLTASNQPASEVVQATGPLQASGRPPPVRAPDRAILLLSGGSQHGAFGAGMLQAWHTNRATHDLPAFQVVTGISTGAILATFAFVNRPDAAVGGYTITHESDLLRLFVKVRDGQPTTASYLSVLRKGAVGDLAPLRSRLHRFIPGTMLEEVYRQSGLDTPDPSDDRRLLVGVVDVDTGRARVLDLTPIAPVSASARMSIGWALRSGCGLSVGCA